MTNIQLHASLSKVVALLLLSNITYASDQLRDWGEYEDTKKEAIERIAKYRKDSTALNIQLPNGKPASSAKVDIELTRHDFLWGAVVKSEHFLDRPHTRKYQEIFLKYFSAAGIANALKPDRRGGPAEKAATKTVEWFKANDFYVRGHLLAWEGANFMREEQLAIYNDKELSDEEKARRLIESMELHFHHAIPKWDVDSWDVSNETIGNNAVNTLLPDADTHVHWYKLADELRKKYGQEHLQLFMNEYQTISAISPHALEQTLPGYKSVGRPKLYKEVIKRKLDLGAPIEGIGFQSRLRRGLISPADVYARLCYYDDLNLPYHCTEFEIRNFKPKAGRSGEPHAYTDDERRLLTEFMMVTCFSHPKVEGFWHWTFSDTEGEVKDWPLFYEDGTPNVNGKTWLDLMDGFFSTKLSAKTDKDGNIDMNGYFGDYEVKVAKTGRTYKGTFKLVKGADNELINVALNP